MRASSVPAPICIALSPQQRRALERCRATATSRRLWCRSTGILMSAAGANASEVATALSVNLSTVTAWRNRWAEGKLFRLSDAPRTGRPPRAGSRYHGLLKEAVVRGPRAYGYVFTVWSLARLAEHMARRTRVRLGRTRLLQLLRASGFVFRRPKHTLKSRQNRRKVAAGMRQLEALKKGLSGLAHATNSGSKMRPTSIFILI